VVNRIAAVIVRHNDSDDTPRGLRKEPPVAIVDGMSQTNAGPRIYAHGKIPRTVPATVKHNFFGMVLFVAVVIPIPNCSGHCHVSILSILLIFPEAQQRVRFLHHPLQPEIISTTYWRSSDHNTLTKPT
jgi:hypothetical protein